jgi:hypothetical protein
MPFSREVEYNSADDEIHFFPFSQPLNGLTEVHLPLFTFSIYMTPGGDIGGFRVGDATRLICEAYRKHPGITVTGLELLASVRQEVLQSCDDEEYCQCEEVLSRLEAILAQAMLEIPAQILKPIIAMVSN